MALRRQVFNVPALEAVACKSAGAQRVVTWEKLGEGSFNKVFLLGFDNNRQAALRIPNPIVPNIRQTTASEVATMEYVRERWINDKMHPSPPKVLAWGGSPDSDVGTPFILVDYVEGVTLSHNWYESETKGTPVGNVLFDAAYFEQHLLSEPFSLHGALYFATDVDPILATHPLYSNQLHADKYKPLADKYRIGPTVQREWFRDVYEQVVSPRGPWRDMRTLIRDAVGLQLQALESGIAFRNPLIRSTPKDKTEIIRYLNMVSGIIDIIVPAGPVLSRPALNHPDLSLGNMIWSKDLKRGLQGVIDWQGTVIHPFCMQAKMAEAFVYRGGKVQTSPNGDVHFPEDFESLSLAMQEEVRLEHRLACRDHAYQRMVYALGDERGESWKLPHVLTLFNLLPVILRVISDGPHDLRAILLEVQERWEEIAAVSGKQRYPCPVDFCPQEGDAIRAETALAQRYEQNVQDLCDAVGCRIDAWISQERFEEGREMVSVLREQWNEEGMGGPFPFLEGSWSPNLT